MLAEVIGDRQFSGGGGRQVAIGEFVTARSRCKPDPIGVLQNCSNNLGVGAVFDANPQSLLAVFLQSRLLAMDVCDARRGVTLPAGINQVLAGGDLRRERERESYQHQRNVSAPLCTCKSS